MRIASWIIVVVLVGVLGVPEEAFAWGPATHVGIATSVLERLSVLPGAVAAVLARHSIAYLYGNVAADIVFAKRFSSVKQFCHHWSTGFGLLDKADDGKAKAFAYGYISHLAADTIAHGKYVPRQIAVSQCAVGAGHFFWELRADATEADANWRLLEETLGDDHSQHHQMLESHITGTFLSFDLNRLLFEGMSALTVRRNFRRTVDAWNRYSRWYLCPELVEGYRAESLDRVLSVLTDGTRSSLLREDPNGTSALMSVRVRRREFRRLKRRGLPVQHRLLEASRGLAPKPSAGLSLRNAGVVAAETKDPTAGGHVLIA